LSLLVAKYLRQVDLSGGLAPYSIDWGSGTMNNLPSGITQITDLECGNYSVTVTDANDCETTCNFAITCLDCTVDISETHVDVLCNGEATGSIDVTITNAVTPITYDWNNGAFNTEDLTDIPAGIYTLNATDAINCLVSITVTITEETPIAVVCNEVSAPSTEGGTDGVGQVDLSGGVAPYSINWGSGTMNNLPIGITQITDLECGDYTVTMTDANDCETTCTFSITCVDCSISTSNVNIGICDDQGTLADDTDDLFEVTLDVTGTGGGTQVLITNNVNTDQWGPFIYGENITIDNLPANGTDIILTFTDMTVDACTSTLTVSQMSCSDCTLTADAGSNQIISCANSTVPLNGNSNEIGVDYLWTGPLGFIAVNAQNTTTDIAGWYYVNVSNTGTGCTAIDSMFVDVSADIPTADAIVSNELNCDNLEATITATSNIATATFAWTGPNGETFNNSEP